MSRGKSARNERAVVSCVAGCVCVGKTFCYLSFANACVTIFISTLLLCVGWQLPDLQLIVGFDSTELLLVGLEVPCEVLHVSIVPNVNIVKSGLFNLRQLQRFPADRVQFDGAGEEGAPPSSEGEDGGQFLVVEPPAQRK